MDFNDDTPLGHGDLITDEEFKLLQLDERIEKDITQSKKINMKKLCRWFDKHNSDFIGIRISKLNPELEILNAVDIMLFNFYFIDNKSIHFIAKELDLTIYSVNRQLNKICKKLINIEGILIKEK